MKTIQEDFTEKINVFKDTVVEMVQGTFNTAGEMDPTVFGLIVKDNKIGLVVLLGLGELFTDDAHKEIAAAGIKKISKEFKFLAVGFAVEAWASNDPLTTGTVVTSEGELEENVIDPENKIEKKEVVLLTFETFDQEAANIWEITRAGDKPKLKRWQKKSWSKKNPNNKGKFADIIVEDYSQFAQELKTTLKDNLN